MRCVDVTSLAKLFRKNCKMSLVAYGISDASGSEEEAETEDNLIDVDHSEAVEGQTLNANVLDSNMVLSDSESEAEDISSVPNQNARMLKLPKPNCETSENKDPVEDDEVMPGSGLFSSLPAPRITSKLSLEMEEHPLSRSKNLGKKETVKISIPSLSEFKDDSEEPERKKLKPSSKGSGLFALLPAPKNMTVKEAKRSLVPNSVTKKSASITINPAPSVTKETETSKPVPLSLTSYDDSGDEMEEGNQGDFFSLNSDAVTESSGGEVPEVEFESDESPTVDSVRTEDSVKSAVLESVPSEPESQWHAASVQGSMDSETKPLDQDDQDLLLNKEAMQRLCGRRAVRDKAAMQLIEVSGDTLMPDPKEWLTKQLTQEQQQKSHSHRKNDGPTTQQKRKHQITYLAFQAKENELELKNQWSQNRMSRKQTQSKYGF